MKINIQVNRSLDGKFRKLEQLVEGFREEYLERMAAEIALNSPTDTGTYASNHNVGVSEVPSTIQQSGTRRPKGTGPYSGPNHSSYIQEGYSKLLSQISTLPEDAIRVVFSNATVYDDLVEFEHGHGVYTRAAREHKRIAGEAEAVAKARFT